MQWCGQQNTPVGQRVKPASFARNKKTREEEEKRRRMWPEHKKESRPCYGLLSCRHPALLLIGPSFSILSSYSYISQGLYVQVVHIARYIWVSSTYFRHVVTKCTNICCDIFGIGTSSAERLRDLDRYINKTVSINDPVVIKF